MTKLKKTLGIPDGIALLVGITIGAGIYSTPQIIATYTNSYASVIMLWLLAAAFVIMGGATRIDGRVQTTRYVSK